MTANKLNPRRRSARHFRAAQRRGRGSGCRREGGAYRRHIVAEVVASSRSGLVELLGASRYALPRACRRRRTRRTMARGVNACGSFSLYFYIKWGLAMPFQSFPTLFINSLRMQVVLGKNLSVREKKKTDNPVYGW